MAGMIARRQSVTGWGGGDFIPLPLAGGVRGGRVAPSYNP